LPRNPALVEARLDKRSYDRAIARLKKYEGRPFKKRMEAVYLAGARLAVAPMRRRAPKRSGLLGRKVSTRKRRPPVGYFVQAGTKSRAPHAGLVSKGHRIVTPGGRDTGRRSTPHPFVVDTIARYEPRIIKFIKDQTTNDGVSVIGSGIRSF
jgi:hypothetical protein